MGGAEKGHLFNCCSVTFTFHCLPSRIVFYRISLMDRRNFEWVSGILEESVKNPQVLKNAIFGWPFGGNHICFDW